MKKSRKTPIHLPLWGRWVLVAVTVAVLIAGVIVVTAPAEHYRPPLVDNPYDPTDFVLEDGFLSCATGKTTLGIDVSEHQQTIDWNAVKNAGVEFVFIRVGWRGISEGAISADKRAQEYYRGAKAAGLLVGGYFFSQAIDPQEAEQEASFAIEQVKDWELDLPLVYDWEYAGENARTANMDCKTLTECTRVFCRRVEDAGFTPMFYFNASQGLHLLKLEELTEFPMWLAQYKDAMTFPHRVDFWQYTGEGTVAGIEVPVDLNLWFTEHPA
jgi:GH25 family lysozyme M1 (1,4-beta-N-acetylmuramidase)